MALSATIGRARKPDAGVDAPMPPRWSLRAADRGRAAPPRSDRGGAARPRSAARSDQRGGIGASTPASGFRARPIVADSAIARFLLHFLSGIVLLYRADVDHSARKI